MKQKKKELSGFVDLWEEENMELQKFPKTEEVVGKVRNSQTPEGERKGGGRGPSIDLTGGKGLLGAVGGNYPSPLNDPMLLKDSTRNGSKSRGLGGRKYGL